MLTAALQIAPINTLCAASTVPAYFQVSVLQVPVNSSMHEGNEVDQIVLRPPRLRMTDALIHRRGYKHDNVLLVENEWLTVCQHSGVGYRVLMVVLV